MNTRKNFGTKIKVEDSQTEFRDTVGLDDIDIQEFTNALKDTNTGTFRDYML